MTIFSDNPHDRRIERFMTAIPNFKPRGVGVRFSESQVLTLERLKGECVKEVKRLNGNFTFHDANDWQKG